ncbi:phage DNA ejection protein [Chimaeribacter arupi]|uniref:phage DNA ejection protein n=1 Tax=Chimaeribacter arupi TaxID=2060066 RepID=UPI0029481D60|nr:phage DNA ejection protein [Chimaeribacter arupi]MDV5140863.1 phage DNA ejection protein [Chimaeribacter arupi]
MAITPFDYTSGNGFAQGLQTAGFFQQVKQQQAAAEQAQQQQAAARQFQQDWQTAYSSGDPAQLEALAGKYPGQMETIQKAIGFKDDNHRMALGSAARDLRVAVQSGNPQAVAQAAQAHAATLSTVGSSPQEVLQQFQQDPQGLMHTVDVVAMNALGIKDFYGVQNDRAQRAHESAQLQETSRHNQTSEQNAIRGQNLVYQSSMTGHNLAAQRLALDQQKFGLEMQQAQQKADQLKDAAPKLSVNMEKSIDQAVNDSTASRNSADQMSGLAQQFRQEKPTTGLFGNANNMFAKLTGSDTTLRDLRIRQNALVNSQVLKFLPPGPATDRDVEIVRQGAPTNMDNPEVVARWLDSMSNLERKSAQFNEFKAEWMSANGNPGQSRTNNQILGLDVKKGESLGQAAKRYMASQSVPSAQSSPAPVAVQPSSTNTVNWNDLP